MNKSDPPSSPQINLKKKVQFRKKPGYIEDTIYYCSENLICHKNIKAYMGMIYINFRTLFT